MFRHIVPEPEDWHRTYIDEIALLKGGSMGRLKIGAFLSSFNLDFRSTLKKAQEIELAGIQLSSLENEINVEEISSKKAAEICRMFEDHNLVITSVCGDIGGFALGDETEARNRIKRTHKIMEITKMLGVSIVQTHIGSIPEDFNGREVRIMKKCLENIGRYGEKIKVFLATETGPEPASTMKRFLDTIKIPSIKVNYDPANLVMNGFDCIAGVYELKDYIIHSHAKDGRKAPDEKGHKEEQPLGKGDVNFREYIKAMDAIGFNGFYVIEREVGEDPVKDITDAKHLLDLF